MVGDIVGSAEIDVLLVPSEVGAWLDRRPVVVLELAVPPVKGGFAGAEPGEIAELRRRRVVQTQQQVALQQLAGAVGQQYDAPGTLMRRPAHDAHVGPHGERRKATAKRCGPIDRALQIHAGKMANAGLGDRRRRAVRPGEQQRHLQQLAPGNVGERLALIQSFVRGCEMVVARKQCRWFALDSELRHFVMEFKLSQSFPRQKSVAEGDAVVVGAQFDLPLQIRRGSKA